MPTKTLHVEPYHALFAAIDAPPSISELHKAEQRTLQSVLQLIRSVASTAAAASELPDRDPVHSTSPALDPGAALVLIYQLADAAENLPATERPTNFEGHALGLSIALLERSLGPDRLPFLASTPWVRQLKDAVDAPAIYGPGGRLTETAAYARLAANESGFLSPFET